MLVEGIINRPITSHFSNNGGSRWESNPPQGAALPLDLKSRNATRPLTTPIIKILKLAHGDNYTINAAGNKA